MGQAEGYVVKKEGGTAHVVPADQIDGDWVSLKIAPDANGFRGKIVAYQTNIDTLGNDQDHWRLPGRPGIYFGYVSCPSLARLASVFTPQASGGDFNIVCHTPFGEKASLKMRPATKDEITSIRKAVNSKKAKIDAHEDFTKALGGPVRDFVRGFKRRVEALKNDQ